MDKPHAAPTARTLDVCRNIGVQERWASLVGGAGLTGYAASRRSGILGMLGGMLMYRGISGHCMIYRQMGISTAHADQPGLLGHEEVVVQTRMFIERPPEVVYRYWRNFENLPRFMRHLKQVHSYGNRSHWEAGGILGQRVSWDAEVTQDTPNERLAWRSVPGSLIQTRGEVLFRAAPKGTELEVRMRYRPRRGALGIWGARLLGGLTEKAVRRDIQRFKGHIEAQAVPAPRRHIPGQELGPEPVTTSHG